MNSAYEINYQMHMHPGMPPHMCSSKIVIPPTPPMDTMPVSKRDSSPTLIYSCSSNDSHSPTRLELTKPPLCPHSTAPTLHPRLAEHTFNCVSPTDSDIQCSAPSLQMKKNFMRKFLSEIAEGY